MPFKDPEKRKEYLQTENGKKSQRITNWKKRGLIHDNIDELYTHYINTTECNVCKHDFSKYIKCMDHNHNTGLFRYILCKNCNVRDNWKKKI